MFKSLTNQIAPLIDHHEYPRRWADYIGQESAKRMLQASARAAKVRKKPLDHVLIAHGSPGIGKTALGSLIAAEMGTTCRVVSGQLSGGRARLLFSEMNDRDVLFYDEFHGVMDRGRKDAEWLLTYLQDGVIQGPLGAEVQPKVTIIAATTDAGRLPETIAGRFPIQPPMSNYSDEEAARIAQVMSKRILGELDLPSLNKKDAAAIAAAGTNNPRAIRRLLVVMRDMTIAGEIPMKSAKAYNIETLLEFQGITNDGLDHVAQRYLTTLAMEFAGTAGAKALEDRLQHAGGLNTVERMLMDKGLVAKTRTGRTLTQAGIGRVRDLMEQVA